MASRQIHELSSIRHPVLSSFDQALCSDTCYRKRLRNITSRSLECISVTTQPGVLTQDTATSATLPTTMSTPTNTRLPTKQSYCKTTYGTSIEPYSSATTLFDWLSTTQVYSFIHTNNASTLNSCMKTTFILVLLHQQLLDLVDFFHHILTGVLQSHNPIMTGY